MVSGRTNQVQDIERLYHGHQGFIVENHPIPRAQPEGEVCKSLVTVVQLLHTKSVDWITQKGSK